MDNGTLLIVGCAGWVVVMWRLHAISEQMRIARAEFRKGAPLTPSEEEAASLGQPPAKNA